MFVQYEFLVILIRNPRHTRSDYSTAVDIRSASTGCQNVRACHVQLARRSVSRSNVRFIHEIIIPTVNLKIALNTRPSWIHFFASAKIFDQIFQLLLWMKRLNNSTLYRWFDQPTPAFEFVYPSRAKSEDNASSRLRILPRCKLKHSLMVVEVGEKRIFSELLCRWRKLPSNIGNITLQLASSHCGTWSLWILWHMENSGPAYLWKKIMGESHWKNTWPWEASVEFMCSR